MAEKINRRRIYFIEKKFQSRFIIKFCLLVILGSLVIGVLLYLLTIGSTTVVFENLRATVKTTADFLFPLLIQTIVVTTVIISIATIILTLFISHKIAGPLYRFKKELISVGSGDLSRNFQIRKNDQLQDLALSMNEMINKLRESLKELNKKYDILKESWGKVRPLISSDNKTVEEIEKTVEEIQKKLEHFKV
ncbi:MAG: methyl-accepting chemotaxis protein [Candidatus Omnitrophica bacterium]|nr:methyl-accepting chemotaxis protein [Candidatus Omnitrophota bacterium]MCM8793573.1 methyl-accepting chemotaxis protein [Candidatus Omnitrophota bacterium]